MSWDPWHCYQLALRRLTLLNNLTGLNLLACCWLNMSNRNLLLLTDLYLVKLLCPGLKLWSGLHVDCLAARKLEWLTGHLDLLSADLNLLTGKLGGQNLLLVDLDGLVGLFSLHGLSSWTRISSPKQRSKKTAG